MAGNAQKLLNQWSLQYLCSWCFSQCSSPECMALSQDFAQVTGVSQTGGFFWCSPLLQSTKSICFGTCKTTVCAQERPKQNFHPTYATTRWRACCLWLVCNAASCGSFLLWKVKQVTFQNRNNLFATAEKYKVNQKWTETPNYSDSSKNGECSVLPAIVPQILQAHLFSTI